MTSLIVRPRRGVFTKDYDTIGKMDPFLKVTIGKETLKTDVADEQGKTPVWTKILEFKLTPDQTKNIGDLQLLFDAYDEDMTSDEYIGSITVKLSELKLKGEVNTLSLNNKKKQFVGTIDVEFEIKQPPQAANTSPSKAKQHIIGTFAIKPGQARFESASGIVDHQELYLICIHGDIAYQTGITEAMGRKTFFGNTIGFQQYEGEDLLIRCFDPHSKTNDMLCGGSIVGLSQLAKRSGVQTQTVALHNNANKPVGELQVEIEFVIDICNNPVQVYAPVNIRRGESISKKVKYYNPDKVRKILKFRSENKDIIAVKTESLSLAGGETGEIRFRFFAPQNSRNQEEKCRIDILVDGNTQTVEESLIFRIRAN